MTAIHRALGLAGAIAITAACGSAAAPVATARPAVFPPERVVEPTRFCPGGIESPLRAERQTSRCSSDQETGGTGSVSSDSAPSSKAGALVSAAGRTMAKTIV